MTPPQTVTEWIQQMRADEAAMPKEPWKAVESPAPDGPWVVEGPAGSVCAARTKQWSRAGIDAAYGTAAGIVAARNSLRRMVDVVAAAHAMSSNFVHATTCGISTDGGPCDCPLQDLRKALAALPVRP